MLTHSFEDLAQSFRMLLEAHYSLNRLLHVDYPEAIGTLEGGINTQLNAFHNINDAIQKNKEIKFDWHTTPELRVLLAIRNARHHNKANRIRTLFNFHRYESNKPQDIAHYFYVDFPAPPEEEGGDFFDIPISWGDLDLFLSLPQKESQLHPEVRGLIREYLNADSFEHQANELGLSKDKIFINFVPLTLNAGIAIYPYIADHIEPDPDSTEASYFLHHFKTTHPALTKKHETGVIAFKLPEK